MELDGLAQIAMNGLDEPEPILHVERPVQAQFLAERRQRLRCRILAELHASRVTRNQMDQHEGDEADEQHNGHEEQQTPDNVHRHRAAPFDRFLALRAGSYPCVSGQKESGSFLHLANANS